MPDKPRIKISARIISARITCVGLASVWAPSAILFHSLPIAGFVVTPDAIAERVLTDPRPCAAANPPITGEGKGDSIPESGAVGTRAHPPD